MTKSRDEVSRAIETTMNWNDERTLDEVEAGIVSPERSGGMKQEGELTEASTAPVLRTFDPARRSVLTTDASGIAVAAILTQLDDAGHQHPIANESRKPTATERAYPAHTLELLVVVHALRVFKHYLLGSGAARPAGCGSDFDRLDGNPR